MDISFNKIEDKIDEHLVLLAALYQLTEKDIKYAKATNNWKGKTLEHKLKLVAAIVAGRTMGAEPFPEVAKYQATFELGNAINGTSKVGAILWGLSEFGLLSAKWGTRGKKIFAGGVVGGVFDPPAFQSSEANPSITTARRSNWR